MTVPVAIPRYPDEVTAAWLNGVLDTEAGTRVEDVQVKAIGTGQTGATYRVNVDYAANPTGLPGTFVIKLPATDDTVRDRVVLGYRSECAFYESVVDRVTVPTPTCFHCEISDDAAEYALLLTDQSPAEQGDQINGCSLEQARSAAVAIAGLHGPTWAQQEWLTFQGLAMSLLDDASKKGLGDVAVLSADITIEKLGDKLSAEDQATFREAMGLVTPWLQNDFGRFSLIHGDYRLDNLLFHPDDGRIWVVDWQTLGVGLPARDLAYFVATSLEPQVRAEAERDLVAAYHRALLDTGVVDYDLETCWQDYRYGMLQVLLISALGFAFAVGTDRGDDMVATMLRRGCAAVRDLGTIAQIRVEAGP
ncbi:phosphotransferase family protein [Mycolicibacterium confluentis]|uniref:Aminoglycoside phosphotransferase n=1 Tax=Mycolicibacterium confluentis TaxID=28047 RepID=A0A7I7XQV6_9MYCO|nr:aminoglycoside phosphotransferase family protein [Mycolicibacterium confluentis]MCV7321016.1 aminoglycoside phosphotransferase family protein [Mycolicibacterium confluentis]ORV25908.1 aminoglycoside phosphotransferase [Mycolicibacterium confluentis]BBZ31618.1 aminoglycoside phosphotransferase [Mycolicibacterium confluentis]